MGLFTRDGQRVSGSEDPRVARLWKPGQGGARRDSASVSTTRL